MGESPRWSLAVSSLLYIQTEGHLTMLRGGMQEANRSAQASRRKLAFFATVKFYVRYLKMLILILLFAY